MSLITVAWRNLWRHRRRSLITAAAMGLGMALCMFTIALTDGMYLQIFDVMVTQNLGHVQVHHPSYPSRHQLGDTVADAAGLLVGIEELPQVQAVSTRVFAFALAGGADGSAGARLVGVDPVREQAVSRAAERVAAGRFLAETPAHEAVIGDGLAEELKLSVGDELVVIGQSAFGAMASDLYTVVGTFHTGSTALDRSGVYLHQADLQTLLDLPNQVHELVVVDQDADQAPILAESIRGLYLPAAAEGAPDPSLLVRTWKEADPTAARLIGTQDVGKYITLGIVFSVAALGVLNTMLMAVFERTRELGVMRALGMTPGQLVALVLLESALLGALSVGFGLVLGGLLDAWVVVQGIPFATPDGKGLTYQGITLDPVIRGVVKADGIVLAAGCLLSVSVLAAVWPAIRAARLRPVDAMRQV